MKKLLTALILLSLVMIGSTALAEKPLTVLFTSDIHSYFQQTEGVVEGTQREHGGAGRLKALLDTNSNDHTILVDAGDFAMGTLLHTGFTKHAYELRLMGLLGYDATTFGNHEFDFGGSGAAEMLQSAIDSGDNLPALLIPANLTLTGTLTEEQQALADALENYGSSRYILKEVGGVRIAVFGLLGKNAISNAPTSGMTWSDPIKAAKEVVSEIGDQADVIICISHSGTKNAGSTGEDVDLAKQVPQIDVVVSGHTHTTLHEAVIPRKGAVLGSCGCFLSYLGRMDLTVNDDGTVTCDNYELIPIDSSVQGDADTDAVVDSYMDEVGEEYLSGTGLSADDVIAHSDFELGSSESGLTVLDELPLGSLIADSYLYACREAGQTDVEIAIVGQGTIRGALMAGDITVSDAFEICSLGMGKDGSAGHPLVTAYITGKQLKIIAEFDALIGSSINSLRMCYAGLNVAFDTGRIPFDRVTKLELVHEDGTTEPIEPNRRYKVCANMYAVNMIGSIKSMTYGIVDLSPTDKDGNVISASEYYNHVLSSSDGSEVKEWVAFMNYLMSFEKVNGVSQVPERYASQQGRKVMSSSAGLAIFVNPGPATLIVIGVGLLIIAVIVLLIVCHKRRKARRAAKK